MSAATKIETPFTDSELLIVVETGTSNEIPASAASHSGKIRLFLCLFGLFLLLVGVGIDVAFVLAQKKKVRKTPHPSHVKAYSSLCIAVNYTHENDVYPEPR